MTEGVSKERLIEIKQSLPYGQARLNLDRLIKAECKELDPWLLVDENMTEGISKDTLLSINPWQYDNQQDLLNAILGLCADIDPWLPIELSIVDNKEYLFITKNKRQRVDRFHPSQYAKVNTDLRWQERPGDRYTHYKLLPEGPK